MAYAQETKLAWQELQQMELPSCTMIDVGLPFQEIVAGLDVQLPENSCCLKLAHVAADRVIQASDLDSLDAGKRTFFSMRHHVLSCCNTICMSCLYCDYREACSCRVERILHPAITV